MASITVAVKHQGKKYDVDIDESTTGEVFKFQLFSLTGVEPDRQKVLIKGGQLKDDTDMSKLGLKAGAIMMMMGTPGGSAEGELSRPMQPTKFLEDMTEAEAAQQEGATPAGLVNLGNTCYLNSSLQVLRGIPELQTALSNYRYRPPTLMARQPTGAAGGQALDLTTNLRTAYRAMSETTGGYSPVQFLQALRMSFPQFAERSKTGHGFAQQDAEEAWSEIINAVRQNIRVPAKGALPPANSASSSSASAGSSLAPPETVSFVDRYMAGEFTSELVCDEAAAIEAGEQPTTLKESFVKLGCHIDGTINHLRDGLLAGLTEKLEKTSPTLERDAPYTKKSRISRLPKYLTVHFVRFFWKRESQKKAKIMRKVTFPQELDVVEFCTDDLRKMLVPVRDKVREVRKEEEDIERSRKRRKQIHAGEEPEADKKAGKKPAVVAAAAAAAGNSTTTATASSSSSTTAAGPAAASSTGATKRSADGDVVMAEETYKTDAEIEAEKAASLLAAKKELAALIHADLLADSGANQSGLYELRGVVTHQGASADSGHYTAYVKKTAPIDAATGKKKAEEDGRWWWFNDDKVAEVDAEKIDSLSGGGESHSALILLYKAIPLPGADGTVVEE